MSEGTPVLEPALAGGPSLRSRATKGAAWTTLQIWFSRLTTAVTFAVLGRLLSPEDFGLVALASGVIAILTVICDAGLSSYVVRQPEVDDVLLSTAFWTSLCTGIVLSTGLVLLAPALADLFDEPSLTNVLRALSLVLLEASSSSVPLALLRRRMLFRSLAIRSTIAILVGAAVGVGLALAGAGVWALVTQALVTTGVGAVILWTKIGWRPRFIFRLDEARNIFRFGIKLLAIDLLMQTRDRGEEFTLASVADSGVLGFWTVSGRIVKMVQDMGSSVVTTVATPAFSQMQQDPPRLFRAYSTAMMLAGMVLFPAMVFLAVTADTTVPLLLGDQWAKTSQVSAIIAVTAALGVFSYFDRALCVAVNRLRAEMILVLLVVVTHLVLVVVFASHGLVVLASVLLARQVLTLPIRQVVLHRVVGAPYSCVLPATRVLVAAVAMAGVLLLLDQSLSVSNGLFLLLIQGAVAGLSFAGFAFLLARPAVNELVRMVRDTLARSASGPA